MLLTLRKAYLVSSSKFNSYKDVPIDKSCLIINCMRSSGPGGQSVNKVNSKVQARLDLEHFAHADAYTISNIKQQHQKKLSKTGELVVRSQATTSQGSNLEDCIEKLQKIIYECSIVQEERKNQISSETEELKEKRLQSKKKKSENKNRRQMNLKFID